MGIRIVEVHHKHGDKGYVYLNQEMVCRCDNSNDDTQDWTPRPVLAHLAYEIELETFMEGALSFFESCESNYKSPRLTARAQGGISIH